MLELALDYLERGFHVIPLGDPFSPIPRRIVEEAGGKTTRLDGSPAGVFDGRFGFAASNSRVHDELLGMLLNPTEVSVS